MKKSKIFEITNTKAVLSALWIFLSVNYIYCDVLTNMESSVLKGLWVGKIGEIVVTPQFILMAALLMEIPFIMIVLSRVLKGNVNRWFNIIAASLMIMVQLGTMSMGTAPTIHYIFSSIMEILGNACIVFIAFKWNYKNTNN